MGSSGGGGSGKVDYPTYSKHVHADWLASIEDPDSPDTHDTISVSMTETMDAALAANPFTSLLVYDPDTVLATVDAQVATVMALSFSGLVNAYDRRVVATAETTFNASVDFAALLTAVKAAVNTDLYSSAEVNDDINAFAALLDDQIDSTVLPRFRRGMQDMNAVMSSAFVIGAALIEEGRDKEVAKYGTGLRLQNYSQRNQFAVTSVISLIQSKIQALTSDGDLAYRMAILDLDFQKAVTTLLLDATRTRIVAKKEELDSELELEEKEAKWELEVFQFGANLLAGISGGASQLVPKQNKIASALGGALSGASAGMAMSGGNPIGGAIGGAIGLIGGLF